MIVALNIIRNLSSLLRNVKALNVSRDTYMLDLWISSCLVSLIRHTQKNFTLHWELGGNFVLFVFFIAIFINLFFSSVLQVNVFLSCLLSPLYIFTCAQFSIHYYTFIVPFSLPSFICLHFQRNNAFHCLIICFTSFYSFSNKRFLT